MEMIYALPAFGLLLLIEFLYGYLKKRNTYHDLKDTVASLSLGITQVIVSIILASTLLAIDNLFYNHRLFEFDNK